MEFVSAIIGPIVESLIIPVKKQLGYLFSSTQHVRNMNTRMKQLDGISSDTRNHKERNNISNLEIPTRVADWLDEVEETKKKAQSISSTDDSRCFNMKLRYRAGRNAFKVAQEIESLIEENSKMIWTDAQKPLGKVNSNIASTSAPPDGDAQNHFKSREHSFKDALESLQQDHKSKVIALCGMGGVGKTTMMEQLKKTVEDKKMFDYVVKVVIGQQINMFSIQQAVAEYMGQSLTETSKTARADHLCLTFGNLPEGKRKVLLILDDVWETIELKDIGLSPFPISFKLLLTSRNENICKHIAVETNMDLKVVRVDVMEETEAHNFFWKIIGVLNQHQELNQIGSDIVRKCGFLPLAIKLIATTLKTQEAFVWRNTLHRLKKNNLDYNVQEIIEISYGYIKEEEEKAIFLLCGLFPDDFNIPIEELTRYAWGMQLLSEVSTLGDTRDRTKTCVQNLKRENLLLDSDYIGCVKMHDLVLSFVLGRVCKGDHPWVINHGDISKWGTTGISESCERISITCKGMSDEFQGDFRYPKVTLLRLIDGDKSLRFPDDFYGRMENLEVVAYEKMQYPLLSRSLECSTKLRTLLLQKCLLMFDCSAIGGLLNLEVLSFAHCGIRKLPSTVKKLKKLKLLDLTGCVNLRIDDGVLKKLVNLEELYMRVVNQKAICFTDENHAELAKLSEHLSALEVEFFDNHGMPENMLFTKLTRFRISMGRGLKGNSVLKMHSYENTLMLVTNKDKLLECGINELFKKTKKLYLEVGGMNDLEEVLVESVQLPGQSFNNLRVLHVFKCENLRYLFTVPMATGLMKLERLTVSECPVVEVLVYSENGGAGAIMFQELKFLILDGLPKLKGLCNTVNVIELPQLVELRLKGLPIFTSIYPENTSATSCTLSNASTNQPFFNKQVMIPKLEILQIFGMDKLKEIWPYQVSDEVNSCMLRKIEVKNCDNIVNLFPRNPMPLLRPLEELDIYFCNGIEVLFNIDMSCVGEIKEYRSNLRCIRVSKLGKLRELWRMKGESSSDILTRSFQAVERIEIDRCESFVNVFTPTVTNSHVRMLMNVSIDGRRPWEESGRNIDIVQKSLEISVVSKAETSEVYGEFSIHPIPNHLERLTIEGCKDVEVVFEIESSSSSSSKRELTTTTPRNHQPLLLLPHLKELYLIHMPRMSYVWKCNWKKLVIPQNQSQSSFHNLTTIYMRQCHSIKYLFSPLLGKLLPNLKKVMIYTCHGIEEVVSDRDDENEATSIPTHTNTIPFPHLEYLKLIFLPRLKSIDVASAITSCTSIHDQFKCSEVVGQLHKLEELSIQECKSTVEEFVSEGVDNDGVHGSNIVGDGNDDTCSTAFTIPRSANMTLLQLPNLTILEIYDCDVLEHIFTSSTLESLKQLKELTIDRCKAMQVIVKEDTETSKTIVFPRLKSLTLADLPNANGFFLGTNEFRWPLLEKVKMYGCPEMVIFTSGHSMAPKLNYIHTALGKHSLECGIDFHLTKATHEPTQFTRDMIKLLQFPWSFSNLVEVHAQWPNKKLLDSRIIFPCNELIHLKNLEKIYISDHDIYGQSRTEEVFEVVEGTNDDDVNEIQSVVVVLPKLEEVTLYSLHKLRHMWKSNPWIMLNFPNLTKVSIKRCGLLGHVFTSCMVDSLLQLQELQISDCENMDVIVEDSETQPEEVVLPSLKSIKLGKLPNLKGFCLGKAAFQWPSLDTLEIKDCPQIAVFTGGQSTAPKLKLIDTTFGMLHATQDPNAFIRTQQQQGWQF